MSDSKEVDGGNLLSATSSHEWIDSTKMEEAILPSVSIEDENGKDDAESCIDDYIECLVDRVVLSSEMQNLKPDKTLKESDCPKSITSPEDVRNLSINIDLDQNLKKSNRCSKEIPLVPDTLSKTKVGPYFKTIAPTGILTNSQPPVSIVGQSDASCVANENECSSPPLPSTWPRTRNATYRKRSRVTDENSHTGAKVIRKEIISSRTKRTFLFQVVTPNVCPSSSSLPKEVASEEPPTDKAIVKRSVCLSPTNTPETENTPLLPQIGLSPTQNDDNIKDFQSNKDNEPTTIGVRKVEENQILDKTIGNNDEIRENSIAERSTIASKESEVVSHTTVSNFEEMIDGTRIEIHNYINLRYELPNETNLVDVNRPNDMSSDNESNTASDALTKNANDKEIKTLSPDLFAQEESTDESDKASDETKINSSYNVTENLVQAGPSGSQTKCQTQLISHRENSSSSNEAELTSDLSQDLFEKNQSASDSSFIEENKIDKGFNKEDSANASSNENSDKESMIGENEKDDMIPESADVHNNSNNAVENVLHKGMPRNHTREDTVILQSLSPKTEEISPVKSSQDLFATGKSETQNVIVCDSHKEECSTSSLEPHDSQELDKASSRSLSQDKYQDGIGDCTELNKDKHTLIQSHFNDPGVSPDSDSSELISSQPTLGTSDKNTQHDEKASIESTLNNKPKENPLKDEHTDNTMDHSQSGDEDILCYSKQNKQSVSENNRCEVAQEPEDGMSPKLRGESNTSIDVLQQTPEKDLEICKTVEKSHSTFIDVQKIPTKNSKDCQLSQQCSQGKQSILKESQNDITHSFKSSKQSSANGKCVLEEFDRHEIDPDYFERKDMGLNAGDDYTVPSMKEPVQESDDVKELISDANVLTSAESNKDETNQDDGSIKTNSQFIKDSENQQVPIITPTIYESDFIRDSENQQVQIITPTIYEPDFIRDSENQQVQIITPTIYESDSLNMDSSLLNNSPDNNVASVLGEDIQTVPEKDNSQDGIDHVSSAKKQIIESKSEVVTNDACCEGKPTLVHSESDDDMPSTGPFIPTQLSDTLMKSLIQDICQSQELDEDFFENHSHIIENTKYKDFYDVILPLDNNVESDKPSDSQIQCPLNTVPDDCREESLEKPTQHQHRSEMSPDSKEKVCTGTKTSKDGHTCAAAKSQNENTDSPQTVPVDLENEEHTVPTAGLILEDEAESSVSFYKNDDSDQVTIEKAGLKRSPNFHWNQANSSDQPSTDGSDVLKPLPRLASTNARLRVGLSRRQKVRHLHKSN